MYLTLSLSATVIPFDKLLFFLFFLSIKVSRPRLPAYYKHVHVAYIVFIAITYYLSSQVYNLWSNENLTYPGGIESNSVISFGRRLR